MFNFIDAQSLKEVLENSQCFLMPVLRYTNTHHLDNELIMLIAFDMETDEGYIFNINHPDVESNSIDAVHLITPKEVWSTDVKSMNWFLPSYSIDVFGWFESADLEIEDDKLCRFYVNLGNVNQQTRLK